MKRLLMVALLVTACGGGVPATTSTTALGAGTAGLIGPTAALATEQTLATERPLATEQPLPTDPPLATDAPPAADPPVATDPPLAADLAVTVTKRTSRVPRNGTASVSIKTAKNASCSIDVQYASGSSSASGLVDKTANAAGVVKWSWKVGGRTTKGTWPIYITCDLGDRSGSVNTEFTVT